MASTEGTKSEIKLSKIRSKRGSGHKFERTKVRIARKSQLLSSRTFVLQLFSVHVEGKEQQNFKAHSE